MISPLDRLNPRERRLLVATAVMLALGAVLFIGRAAMGTVGDLNARIADRELELEGLTQQKVQAGAVNAAYSRVVKQHSSVFTVAEIHDNLRREIVRLTQVDFPGTAEKPAQKFQLVSIPALEEGQLTQGEGHREYRIRFQVPGANLDFLLAFLERIEESELLLRIDNLEIGRVPGSYGVYASVEITRTVLDDPEGVNGASGGNSQ
jgi:hypothetical protein